MNLQKIVCISNFSFGSERILKVRMPFEERVGSLGCRLGGVDSVSGKRQLALRALEVVVEGELAAELGRDARRKEAKLRFNKTRKRVLILNLGKLVISAVNTAHNGQQEVANDWIHM